MNNGLFNYISTKVYTGLKCLTSLTSAMSSKDCSVNSGAVETQNIIEGDEIIVGHSSVFAADSTMISEDGESSHNGLVNSQQLIDFEELIELTNDDENTLRNINEFETVLSNFDTFTNIDENIINLDEFNDLFGDNNKDFLINDGDKQNLIDFSINTSDISVSNINAIKIDHNYTLKSNITQKVNCTSHDTVEASLETKENSQFTQNNKIDHSKTVDVNFIPTIYENVVSSRQNDIQSNNLEENSQVYDNANNNTALTLNNVNDQTETQDNVIETISISSDDDDGYNSSDFEFITEEEAKKYALEINSNENSPTNTKVDDNLQINKENMSDPAAGPSNKDAVLIDNRRNYRQNHIIPQGDHYVNLFQGPFNPVMSMVDIIILENKSTRPSPMNIQYEGIGFDRHMMERRHRRDSAEEEYADEAKENAKMILSMYPGENRKRRRRF